MKAKFYIALLALAALYAPESLAQSDISKLDSNFAVEKVDGMPVVYRDALEAPFVLEGFPFWEKGKPLRRVPDSVTPENVSPGVFSLANHTSGGVIRFRTDAKVITIKASIRNRKMNMGHMPSTGSSGFDLFMDKDVYVKTVNPSHWQSEIPDPLIAPLKHSGDGKMHDYTLYLPLYNGVNKLEIGVSPDAKFEPPTPHKIKKPIVFYGSSITQGACASRTSMPYMALLCRDVDAPFVNLGFSGNARGEPKMAQVVASIDMSAFFLDYDHNARSAQELADTHEKFFKTVRKAHPNVPIIILSRTTCAREDRTAVIRKTYENAVKNGDKKVWFFDGRDLFKELPESILTVDGVHPNDIGFYLMYKNTLPALKKALGIKK